MLLATTAACGSAADDKHPDHRAFAVHGRTLTVDSDSSALEIVPAEGDQVKVTRWFHGTALIGKDPRATWSVRGDRLVLRVKCAGLIADCSARHRIEVPRGIGVTVEDHNGSVRAQGIKGELSIRTSNGSVRVTDSTGALTLKSNNGSVRATGVGSRRVHAETHNGPVHLELAAAPELVEAASRNGSVSITVPRTGYRVTTDSHNGSVHVSVPRDAHSSHAVRARTSNGSINVRTAD
ncbi:DUF4097 family beta strand repeat-containing protein [Streptomyces macrolidinus]|uniref:DUF4097 family beta strand repeat-containing protein n=1 Tax=Streptomyces macrolidinus TaxID=2952607 RepID=UPI0027E2D42B|nr:DUF4097 family beta strand repeat-containing protein [Streptomyces macrolidinus]